MTKRFPARPGRPKRNGMVYVAGWIPESHYDALQRSASPDLGDRWLSHLLRAIIREWIEEHPTKKVLISNTKNTSSHRVSDNIPNSSVAANNISENIPKP